MANEVRHPPAFRPSLAQQDKRKPPDADKTTATRRVHSKTTHNTRALQLRFQPQQAESLGGASTGMHNTSDMFCKKLCSDTNVNVWFVSLSQRVSYSRLHALPCLLLLVMLTPEVDIPCGALQGETLRFCLKALWRDLPQLEQRIAVLRKGVNSTSLLFSCLQHLQQPTPLIRTLGTFSRGGGCRLTCRIGPGAARAQKWPNWASAPRR